MTCNMVCAFCERVGRTSIVSVRKYSSRFFDRAAPRGLYRVDRGPTSGSILLRAYETQNRLGEIGQQAHESAADRGECSLLVHGTSLLRCAKHSANFGVAISHANETSPRSRFGKYLDARRCADAPRCTDPSRCRQPRGVRRSREASRSGLSNFRRLFLRCPRRLMPVASRHARSSDWRESEGQGDRLRNGAVPCTEDRRSSCDWLFQPPPSAPFLPPQPLEPSAFGFTRILRS